MNPPRQVIAALVAAFVAEVQRNAKASLAVHQLAEMLTGRAVSAAPRKGISFLPFLNRKAG